MMTTSFAARCAGLCLATGLLAASLPMAKAQTASEPRRIVTIGGAVTETLFLLGQQDRIVARDSTSLYPAEALAKPDVGYMRALSAEGVLSMAPDLILMEEGAGPPDAVALIERSGARVVRVPSGYRAEGLPQKIRDVAAAAGAVQAGAALADDVEARLETLKRDLAAGAASPKRVLFIMSFSDGRPMAAGTGTAADAMIRLAGGENVLAGMQGYKTLSAEAAVGLQPDVVLMADHAGPIGATGDVLALPALANTPAGRNRALIRMDGLYLLGFGPRTPAAARDLAAQLYPTLNQGWAP
jgi:iron complex transport system substrate-binding protein